MLLLPSPPHWPLGRFSALTLSFHLSRYLEPRSCWGGNAKPPPGQSRDEKRSLDDQDGAFLLHLPQASCTFSCCFLFIAAAKKPKSLCVCSKPPSPSFTCSLLPSMSLDRGAPHLSEQTSPGATAKLQSVFFSLLSLASFSIIIFFSPQQPRNLCQNVFSTCSLLVTLSVSQICYQCHQTMLLIQLPTSSRARQPNSRQRS